MGRKRTAPGKGQHGRKSPLHLVANKRNKGKYGKTVVPGWRIPIRLLQRINHQRILQETTNADIVRQCLAYALDKLEEATNMKERRSSPVMMADPGKEPKGLGNGNTEREPDG